MIKHILLTLPINKLKFQITKQVCNLKSRNPYYYNIEQVLMQIFYIKKYSLIYNVNMGKVLDKITYFKPKIKNIIKIFIMVLILLSSMPLFC